jgi:hypothetical protein
MWLAGFEPAFRRPKRRIVPDWTTTTRIGEAGFEPTISWTQATGVDHYPTRHRYNTVLGILSLKGFDYRRK